MILTDQVVRGDCAPRTNLIPGPVLLARRALTSALEVATLLRLIVWTTVARLRAAGAVPWVLLVGWVLFSALQEPVLFRRLGVHLVGQASWVGGVILFVVVVLAEPRTPGRFAWLANLALLAVVSLAQGSVAMLADLFSRDAEPMRHLTACCTFFVCWAPLAMVFAGLASHPWPHTIALSILVLMLGSAQSVAIQYGEALSSCFASLLAAAGAAAWLARRT